MDERTWSWEGRHALEQNGHGEAIALGALVFAASEAAITLFWRRGGVKEYKLARAWGVALKTQTMTNLVLGLGLGLGLPARVWLGLRDNPAHRPRRLMVKPARIRTNKY